MNLGSWLILAIVAAVAALAARSALSKRHSCCDAGDSAHDTDAPSCCQSGCDGCSCSGCPGSSIALMPTIKLAEPADE